MIFFGSVFRLFKSSDLWTERFLISKRYLQSFEIVSYVPEGEI